MTDCKPEKLGFKGLGSRQVTARFDGGMITSDAGVLLLRELEERLGIIERLAACFDDYRNPTYVEHSVEQLLKQRIFGLILGYEDINDHQTLRDDTALAVGCGKDDPEGNDRFQKADRGTPLGSPSTLNRLERGVVDGSADDRHKKIVCDLAKVEALLVELWLDSLDEAPGCLVIDLDATDVALHGDQEDKFYHGYYGHYCYLPLYIFCGDWLLSSLLRFAGQDTADDCLRPLEMLVDAVQNRFPSTQIIIRGDSGFARDHIFAWCEQWDVDYVIGIAKNSRLNEQLAPMMDRAQQQFEKTGQKVRWFDDFDYRTVDSWSKTRRVIGKAEYSERGKNPRYVVTSLLRSDVCAKAIYEVLYCQRGEAENRIKEVQLPLFADRMSTEYRASNQLRFYFSSIAYLFVCWLRRLALKGTDWARLQASTLRARLFKIGAQIKVTTRRVWFRLASSYPYQSMFHQAVKRIRAGP